MPRTKTTRNASGSGHIRQRSNGLWEGQYSVGRDPGTGKQIRRSVYGKSQADVRKKLAKIETQIDSGTYQEPEKVTVSQWLDMWLKSYCINLKPRTLALYKATIANRIKPNLGAVKLRKLTAPMIQEFYKDALDGNLKAPAPDSKKKFKSNSPRVNFRETLSPKTVKNLHGILHKALSSAVRAGMIPVNPADSAELPRIERHEIEPLPESAVPAFIKALNGDRYEIPINVDLLTGLRQGELLGLSWAAVDSSAGTITVKQQLQRQGKEYVIAPTKNDKVRVVSPAPAAFELLRKQEKIQAERKAAAGRFWNNPDDLVFTNELGGHLTPGNVYRHLKKAVAAIGLPEFRFHDLRHTFAVYSLESGADVKSVQSALGHYSAAFTLDVYTHSTEQMQQRNAQRMQDFMDSLIKPVKKKNGQSKKD